MRHVPILSADPAVHDAIAAVVGTLPPDAASYLADRCTFVVVGNGYYGRTQHKHYVKGDWLIVLDAAAPNREAIIAHETAHAWLKHGAPGDLRDEATCEREAWDQAAAWGFPRPT